jgi:hypothetical protein
VSLEVFLDDTPGEVRGVVVRDGRFEHLLIQREDDLPEHRLGARCVGRIAEVHAGLKGGFVDLGPTVHGFLPFRGQDRLTVGQKVAVEVSAEPREGKGPTLRLIGPGEGEPSPSGVCQPSRRVATRKRRPAGPANSFRTRVST